MSLFIINKPNYLVYRNNHILHYSNTGMREWLGENACGPLHFACRLRFTGFCSLLPKWHFCSVGKSGVR